MQRRSRRLCLTGRRPGITLIELLLALALSGVVALASVAVASLLQVPDLSPDNASNPKAALNRGLTWVDDLIRRSRAVGYAGDGTASPGGEKVGDGEEDGEGGEATEGETETSTTGRSVLVLWHEDTFTNTQFREHDFTMQFYELRLLHHDAVTGELVLYAPKDYATLTRAERDAAAAVVSESEFNSPDLVDHFTTASWMQKIRIVGNACTLAEATFAKDDSGARTAVNYRLDVQFEPLDGSAAGERWSVHRSVMLMKSTSPGVWSDHRKLRAPDPSAAL